MSYCNQLFRFTAAVEIATVYRVRYALSDLAVFLGGQLPLQTVDPI